VRPALASRNGMPPGTVLVDGEVAGTWVLRRERLPRPAGTRGKRELARLTITPLRPWPRGARSEVTAEAERLARFAADDAHDHAVTVAERT
jgi:hypothetical protein